MAPLARPEPVVPNTTSVRLYRELIRTVLSFPVERLRPKIRFNIYEAFLLNRLEKDPERLAEMHEHAQRSLKFLQVVSKVDRPTLELLFSRALNTDGQFHSSNVAATSTQEGAEEEEGEGEKS